MALLDVKKLTKNFGGLTAVGDVTMHLNEGELVGLIGPNGAGKTTLFNLLTGVYEPSEGTVSLDGTILNGMKPYKIASLGLSRTFQNIRLFKEMTVLDNVLIGMANQTSPLAKILPKRGRIASKGLGFIGYFQFGNRS